MLLDGGKFLKSDIQLVLPFISAVYFYIQVAFGFPSIETCLVLLVKGDQSRSEPSVS